MSQQDDKEPIIRIHFRDREPWDVRVTKGTFPDQVDRIELLPDRPNARNVWLNPVVRVGGSKYRPYHRRKPIHRRR